MPITMDRIGAPPSLAPSPPPSALGEEEAREEEEEEGEEDEDCQKVASRPRRVRKARGRRS